MGGHRRWRVSGGPGHGSPRASRCTARIQAVSDWRQRRGHLRRARAEQHPARRSRRRWIGSLACRRSTDMVRHHTDPDRCRPGPAAAPLLADWQLLADLSFADLVLWVPDRDGTRFWAGARRCGRRPGRRRTTTTWSGRSCRAGGGRCSTQALDEGRIFREGDPDWRDDVPVRGESDPGAPGGRVIAVIARNTNLLGVRTPSQLELAYLQSAADLAAMVADGSFPSPGSAATRSSPRVGDGFVRLDADGRGHLRQPERAVGVPPARADRRPASAPTWPTSPRARCRPRRRPGRARPRRGAARPDGRASTEVERRRRRRDPAGDPAAAATASTIGALVLLRDVTELRRRERELMTKDATIREIHHRVKNNLQTVAALLRLQARRIDAPEAQAALEEAVRRVGSIAIVHETLSARRSTSRSTSTRSPTGCAMVADVCAGRPARSVTAGGRDRSACCRPSGDAAGDGAHRARAERRRARLRRTAGTPGRSWSCRADRRPAAPDRRRRRGGAAGRLRPGAVGRTWGCRSCARWSSPSSAGCSSWAGPDGGTRVVVDIPWQRTRAADRVASRSEPAAVSQPCKPIGEVGQGDSSGGRIRARALRRLRARRSSSLRPPHTPGSWPASSAHARHCSRTSQRRHTALASSICRIAGPVLPIGKNSSGSSSRHAARWRQSMGCSSSLPDGPNLGDPPRGHVNTFTNNRTNTMAHDPASAPDVGRRSIVEHRWPVRYHKDARKRCRCAQPRALVCSITHNDVRHIQRRPSHTTRPIGQRFPVPADWSRLSVLSVGC